MKPTIFILTALTAVALTAGPGLAAKGTGSAAGTTSIGGNAFRGVETRLEDFSTQVGTDATRLGDATFTERFATQFGVTVDVLTQQRTQFQADWGDLFLAYTIVDASRTSVTLDDIFAMRASGQSWTSIASSLRIPPGRLMRTVQTQMQTFRTDTSGGATSGRGRSGSHGLGSESGNRTSGGASTGGVNRQIDARLQTLDDQLTRLDDAAVADRLAQDFGVTADVLTAQRAQFNADWSDILVAYTIADRARTTVTVDQIMTRYANGESWTEIARTLRVPPGQLLRGIRTETQALAGSTTRTGTSTETGGTSGTLHGSRASVKGSADMRTSLKGSMKSTSMKGAAAMKAHGGAAATRISAGSTTRISSTTLTTTRGAAMRAAVQGAMKIHGRK